MIKQLKWIGAAGSLLLVTACATTLEPDGRLDSARDRVEAAAAYGTSSTAYSRAAGFLGDAEAALESGEANTYDKTVELSDAYAQVAIAEGELGEAREAADGLRSDLETTSGEAMQCKADLAACQAAPRPTGTSMSQTLNLLAGTMRCTMTDRGSGTVALSCPGLGFGFDQSKLTVAGDARMTALSQFLSTYGGVAVELVGHTDSTGPEGWNQSLSERRAAAASRFLQNEGISAGRITTSGEGETSPVASNDTRAGRAQNRRVDVILKGVTTAGSMAAARDI